MEAQQKSPVYTESAKFQLKDVKYQIEQGLGGQDIAGLESRTYEMEMQGRVPGKGNAIGEILQRKILDLQQLEDEQ